MKNKHKDLVCISFGKWTVSEQAETCKNSCGRNVRYWKCRCSCGTERDVKEYSLLSGASISCGCERLTKMHEAARKAVTTHGMSYSRLYAIYKHIMNRCNNKHDVRYYRYGGRGISVCDEWESSFEAFEIWAYANGYSDSLSIDRIDIDKGYCPENCRWSDVVTQANNKSNNKVYSFDGESHTIAEWSRIKGINYKKLWKRLEVFHWSIKKALTA